MSAQRHDWNSGLGVVGVVHCTWGAQRGIREGSPKTWRIDICLSARQGRNRVPDMGISWCKCVLILESIGHSVSV